MSIEKYTFKSCMKLTGLKIPEGVSIGEGAFKYCIGLTSIEIPKGVSIGEDTFSGCTGLTDIKISKNVSIGVNAFNDCTNLARVEVSADQDLSIAGLKSGVRVIRRAYHFMPNLPKVYCFDWDSNTFGIGKKLTILVLLCIRRWGMESQSLGLPPEMALMILFFMNVQVSKKIEVEIPLDRELAENILKLIEVVDVLEREGWFKSFKRISTDRQMFSA